MVENSQPAREVTLGVEGEFVTSERFAPGVELLTVRWQDGRAAGTLLQQVDVEVTASDLRALADVWEAYPAWLRARAAELEG